MLFNKRGSFQKTTIYYCMIFNLCAYWNETRGTVFNKKKHKFITVCYSTCVRIEMKQEGYFSKKIQLMTICCWTSERKETRGAVFKKQQFITVCYSTCVRIEMKQEGQFSKKKLIYYSMLFNKRGSFQKTTIYYCMIFNLCAYWNETRGTVFNKKKHKFITVCYSTCVRIEMKQEGYFSKKIQLMTICCWTSERKETRGAVFKKQQFITVCYSTCVRIEMKQEGQFSKKKLIYYSMLFNKRGSYQKTTIYYCMIFNLCAYWNETRGTVFNKKKHKFITVCYSTCVRIEMKQEGQFLKKNTNLLQYAIQLVCELRWNKRDSFQQKKHKFITVCYSTCVRIEMKQEGQFLKKNTNLLQYAI